MSGHTHTWRREPRADAPRGGAVRYRCECGTWGYRVGSYPSVRAYKGPQPQLEAMLRDEQNPRSVGKAPSLDDYDRGGE